MAGPCTSGKLWRGQAFGTDNLNCCFVPPEVSCLKGETERLLIPDQDAPAALHISHSTLNGMANAAQI